MIDIGAPPKVYTRSIEARLRMSASQKARFADPNVRKRMSEAGKKALADPDVRKRMSEARKKQWADPDVRKRMSEARKKALADPDVRKRILLRRDQRGNNVCAACAEGNCLACDGDGCRCVCSLYLDQKRRPGVRR